MNTDEYKAWCLAKPGAYEDNPFGVSPICCKVAGRIFAQFYTDGRITVKCTQAQAAEDRNAYPEAVLQAGPAQWSFWNTVKSELLSEEVCKTMLDRSYTCVFSGLPQWQQKEITEAPTPEEVPKGRFRRKRKSEE